MNVFALTGVPRQRCVVPESPGRPQPRSDPSHLRRGRHRRRRRRMLSRWAHALAAPTFVAGATGCASPTAALLADRQQWVTLVVFVVVTLAMTGVALAPLGDTAWLALLICLAAMVVIDTVVVAAGAYSEVQRLARREPSEPPGALGLMVALVTLVGTHQVLARILAGALAKPDDDRSHLATGNLLAALPVACVLGTAVALVFAEGL